MCVNVLSAGQELGGGVTWLLFEHPMQWKLFDF